MVGLGCCFFGPETIVDKGEALAKVKKILSSVVAERGIKEFLFCGNGDFVDICYEVAQFLQKSNLTVKITACVCKDEWACLKSDFGYEDNIKEVFGVELKLKTYDAVEKVCSKTFGSSGSVSALNNKVILRSDTCLFYGDGSLFDDSALIGRTSDQPDIRRMQLAYRYARRHNKNTINVKECK